MSLIDNHDDQCVITTEDKILTKNEHGSNVLKYPENNKYICPYKYCNKPDHYDKKLYGSCKIFNKITCINCFREFTIAQKNFIENYEFAINSEYMIVRISSTRCVLFKGLEGNTCKYQFISCIDTQLFMWPINEEINYIVPLSKNGIVYSVIAVCKSENKVLLDFNSDHKEITITNKNRKKVSKFIYESKLILKEKIKIVYNKIYDNNSIDS